MSKVLAISDLHGYLPEIPECDVLLIAGDVCPVFDHSLSFQLVWLDTNFRRWLESSPTDNIIGIAGNHDFIFEQRPEQVERLGLPWLYRQDNAYKLKGVKYYGIPWVPNLMQWAFYANDITLQTFYDQIPNDTDVIISHGPPRKYCDKIPSYGGVGSMAARTAVDRVHPKAFVCGHIHEGFGQKTRQAAVNAPVTTIYNVAHVDENYNPIHPFTEIEVD
jgi:Icc-related predicted phosphoesterase